MISSLPKNEELVGQREFPNLASFLKELITRGLFELAQEEWLAYFCGKIKSNKGASPNCSFKFRTGSI